MTEPIVHGHMLRVRRNQRTEIQASEEYPSLPLLVSGGGELGGHTYQQAQGDLLPCASTRNPIERHSSS